MTMKPHRGFTLLELLLVLALVGLLTALVAPRLATWVDGARSRAALDAIRTRLEAERSLAFHEGRPREVNAANAGRELPAGWRLELARPLIWEANGMARGGRLRLWNGREMLADWVVEPVAGDVRRATAADGPFGGGDRARGEAALLPERAATRGAS